MQSRYAPTHNLDWNDLRYLLAVADGGSLSAAAKALHVNHSTVLRRIGAFEAQLGLRLFERSPTGYALTAGGEELARVARQIADAVDGVERRVMGQDVRLSGSVRVTTTDTLALSVLPPLLTKFRSQHDQVQIELATGNSQADLSRRDADVALRPTAQPPELLLGRRVARVAYAMYAAPSYLAQHSARQALSKHIWVAPDDSMASTQVGVYMARTLQDAAISFRANSLATLARAAAAGLGVAILPCYLGDSSVGLQRLRGPLPDTAIDLWLLTHRDLRKTARVRAVIDFLANELTALQDLLEGRRPNKHVAP
jgi:DNA-binding transcriptional LysR family regulator